MTAKKKVAKKVAKKKVAKKSTGTLAVLVSRFGHDPVPVAVPKGATVGDVLKKVALTLNEREQAYVNGDYARMEDKVSDQDVVAIVSPKAAGAK